MEGKITIDPLGGKNVDEIVNSVFGAFGWTGKRITLTKQRLHSGRSRGLNLLRGI